MTDQHCLENTAHVCMREHRWADALALIECLVAQYSTTASSGSGGFLKHNEWRTNRAEALLLVGRVDEALKAAAEVFDAVSSSQQAPVLQPSLDLTSSKPSQPIDDTARDALHQRACVIAMNAAARLGQWRRCRLFAEHIAYSSDSCATDALIAVGYACCAPGGFVHEAADYFRQALLRDPMRIGSLRAIMSNFLLPIKEQTALIRELDLASPGLECVRNSYLAQVLDPRVTPSRWDGVPSYLRHYKIALGHLWLNDLAGAVKSSSQSVKDSPMFRDGILLHCAVLFALRDVANLFQFAHQVCDTSAGILPLGTFSTTNSTQSMAGASAGASSQSFSASRATISPDALYAVGCYYFAVANFDKAGRCFARATEADPHFPAAWIAYGHCYSRLEEGEQALAAYRRALSLFPCMIQCHTYIGMQYSRSRSYALARAHLEEAERFAVQQQQEPDVLTLNELGVIAFRDRNYEQAEKYFTKARDCLANPDSPNEFEVSILYNLATSHRKLGNLDIAINLYSQFVRLRPYAVCGHSALGFALHCKGHTKVAIECYHTALSMKNDGFTRDLLERALGDEYSQDVGCDEWSNRSALHSHSRQIYGTDVVRASSSVSPTLNLSDLSGIGRGSESVTRASVSPAVDRTLF